MSLPSRLDEEMRLMVLPRLVPGRVASCSSVTGRSCSVLSVSESVLRSWPRTVLLRKSSRAALTPAAATGELLLSPLFSLSTLQKNDQPPAVM